MAARGWALGVHGTGAGRVRVGHAAGVFGVSGSRACCGHRVGAGLDQGGYWTGEGQAHGWKAWSDGRANAWLALGGCVACVEKARGATSFKRGH